MGMKFAVSTFASTRDAVLPEDLFPKLAEWGYDGVELWGGRPHKEGQQKFCLEDRTEDEINQLKHLVEKYGLEVPAVSTYFTFTSGKEAYEKSLQTGRKYAKIARLFGAKVIRVVDERVSSADMTEDKWKVFIKGLKDLASIGDEYDVIFGLELHPKTPHDTVLGQLRCIWQADSPRIRTIYQPSTTPKIEPEMDLMWALDKLFPYIVHVHIQPSIQKSNFEDDALTSRGYGHVHWSQILGELKRRKYSRYITVERVPQPVLENLQRAIRWLKKFS